MSCALAIVAIIPLIPQRTERGTSKVAEIILGTTDYYMTGFRLELEEDGDGFIQESQDITFYNTDLFRRLDALAVSVYHTLTARYGTHWPSSVQFPDKPYTLPTEKAGEEHA